MSCLYSVSIFVVSEKRFCRIDMWGIDMISSADKPIRSPLTRFVIENEFS